MRHHGDLGSQYASLLLSKTMREHGIRPSMGPVSSTWDDAAMESLMDIVKSECVHARACVTCEEAALDPFDRIEVVYNRARINSAPSYLSPVEFERPIGPREIAARTRRKGHQRNRGRFRFMLSYRKHVDSTLAVERPSGSRNNSFEWKLMPRNCR